MYFEKYDAHFVPLKARTGSSLQWDFFTEIQTAENGSEERISLRPLPVPVVQYSYAYFKEQFEMVNSTFMNHLRDKWIIPCWYFVRNITAENVIYFDEFPSKLIWIDDYFADQPHNDSIKNGDTILLWKNENDFYFVDVFEVLWLWNGVSGTALRLEDGYAEFNFSGYKVFPVTFGFISGDADVQTNKKYCTTSIVYDVTHLPEVTELEPIEQFEGHDVYRECLLLEGDALGISHVQPRIESGNTLGIKNYRTNFEHSYRNLAMRKVLFNRFDHWNFLRWLMRRLGQFRPFYMPTYTSDFEVLYHDSEGVVTRYADPSILTFAVIRGGEFHLYKADSVFTNGEISRFSIDGFDFNDTDRLCYAMLYRLDTDTVEINYLENRGMVESIFELRSVR